MKVALILLLFLTACGGGGAVTQVTQAKSGIIRITGDSTCYGSAYDPLTRTYFRVASPWPTYIHVPGFTIDMSNCIGGQALGDVLPTWAATIASDGATVELIADAINDAFQVSPALYAAQLREVIRASRERGKFVVLMTPNPTYEARVTALAQVIRDVGIETSTPVIDNDTFMRSTFGADLSFAGDQMHPSQPAYALIGGFVNGRLLELLR